jgi:hypothetical protein
MQRLQAWAQHAAQQLPTGTTKRQQQKQDDDEEHFIYGRVAVYSDDEDTGRIEVSRRISLAWLLLLCADTEGTGVQELYPTCRVLVLAELYACVHRVVDTGFSRII